MTLVPRTITVDPLVWEKFKSLAENKCINRSALIRKWIETYLIKNNINIKN